MDECIRKMNAAYYRTFHLQDRLQAVRHLRGHFFEQSPEWDHLNQQGMILAAEWHRTNRFVSKTLNQVKTHFAS